MIGVQKLYPSVQDGVGRLINIDGFKFDDVVVSSAGGRRETYVRRLSTTKPTRDRCCSINISGFRGGHSGYDIDKELANAIKLMGHFLSDLDIPYALAFLHGGSSHNAIPTHCTADIVIDRIHVEVLERERLRLQQKILKMYAGTDDGGTVTVMQKHMPQQVWTQDCLNNTLNLILLIFNGVYSMNNYIPDQVSSSSNLGLIRVNGKGQIEIGSMIRCAVDANEEIISKQHEKAAELTGFDTYFQGYKGWPGMAVNPLAELMNRIYKKNTGGSLNITATHAGLETSIFHQMKTDLVMVNIGMDVVGPHSLDEHVRLDSIPPFIRLLRATLRHLSIQE